MAPKQPPPRQRPPRKRSSLPRVLYWLTFLACTGASAVAGFWFTYRYSSQLDVRGPEPPIASPTVELATPYPLVSAYGAATPDTAATPEDLFAGQPATTPLPSPADTPIPTPTPPSFDAAATATQPPDQQAVTSPQAATPEPTPEDDYRVQVGSFDSRDAAEGTVQDLLAAGIEAVVVYDETKYHAQVGAYRSKDRALEVADEVNAKGFAVTIRH